jgi:hypothetical protein
MSVSREILGLAAICAIVVLLSLLGVVWALISGLLYPHILLDGLLLVLICLMMGGIFSIMLFFIARDYGLIPHKRPAAEAAPGNPQGAASEKGQ